MREVDAAIRRVDAAEHRLHRSAPLSLVRIVPGLSAQRTGAFRLVADTKTAAGAARQLLADLDHLAPGGSLSNGAIPLDKLGELQAALSVAGTRLDSVVGTTRGLWGPLRSARARFDSYAKQASVRLVGAADGLEATRAFLGAGGPRTYFVAIQNNSEARDQGMVLSYAVVRAEGGRIFLVKNGSVKDVGLSAPADVAIPPGTATVFGSLAPTTLWQSVNATADFAWSGTAMRAMYHKATGQDIDGVVAIDVPGLAAILKVTGLVAVPGLPAPLTSANASQQLMHDLYQHRPHDQAANDHEKEVTSNAAKSLIDRLTRGPVDAVALGQELGAAASGGHFRLWSRFAPEERQLERAGLAGGPAAKFADRTFHVAVESRAPTKMDYYIQPSVKQQVTLTRAGDAVVKTTIMVDNQAPAGAPPSEQLGPNDASTAKPGDYIAWVLLWGPQASTQDASVPESGLQLTQSVLFVPAGQQRQAAVVTTVVPHAVRDGRLDLRFVPQPRVAPISLAVTLDAPGWHVTGTRAKTVAWDQIVDISWGVAR